MFWPNHKCLSTFTRSILDISISDNEKYIVTCDNDEKIRVSHYPNGKNIVHYMMGHEAYVSGICLLNNFILSGSGDSTLRLWDFDNGDRSMWW